LPIYSKTTGLLQVAFRKSCKKNVGTLWEKAVGCIVSYYCLSNSYFTDYVNCRLPFLNHLHHGLCPLSYVIHDIEKLNATFQGPWVKMSSTLEKYCFYHYF
jgi:hypothetical protein